MLNSLFDIDNCLDYLTENGDMLPRLKKLVPWEKFRSDLEVIYNHEHKAKEQAKAHGAKKLYISAHSAAESQVFYYKMGCAEAAAYNQTPVEAEPYDCQLESHLS